MTITASELAQSVTALTAVLTASTPGLPRIAGRTRITYQFLTTSTYRATDYSTGLDQSVPDVLAIQNVNSVRALTQGPINDLGKALRGAIWRGAVKDKTQSCRCPKNRMERTRQTSDRLPSACSYSSTRCSHGRANT